MISFKRKAQAEVITTVLIILLVLAAIVIVWQVVRGTISNSSNQISAQSNCINANMEITNANAGSSNVTVRRGQGTTDVVVTGYKLFRNGAQVGADKLPVGGLTPLATDTFTGIAPVLVSGDKVSAASIMGTTVCAAGSELAVK